MAQLIADRRDVDFVLHEQIGMVEHESLDKFNKKTIDLIVSEARNLAIKEILPTFKHGAAKLIEAFGDENQKKLYIKKMFAGIWNGTMLLTELETGSDVGALTTMAVKNEDGSLGDFNNVVWTGLEHKIGIHENFTASLFLGENGKYIGTLLGIENKGMSAAIGIILTNQYIGTFNQFADMTTHSSDCCIPV